MTDHTIKAHLEVDSASAVGVTFDSAEEERVIRAMAKAIGGESNSDHPKVIFEATKIYLAVKAMREAESQSA